MGFKSKLKNFNECRLNSSIYEAYYNSQIDERIVYLESRNGSDFAGNICGKAFGKPSGGHESKSL